MKLNKSKHCLNCNEEIHDSNYCPNCGQLNSDKKLTLKQILKDFLGDYFTFDSKFFRSLVPLLIKPGYLTREYINGKRVRYIFPLRLYIFTTFVFFFVLTLNTKLDYDKYSTSADSVDAPIISTDSLNTKSSYREKFDKELNQGILYGIDSAKIGDEVKVEGPGFKFSFNDTTINDSPFINYINNKAKHLSTLGKEGSHIFFKEMINQIPKLMFLLLPIFALILKLIYFRNKMFYAEHLVFSLHIHTFFFLIMIITVFFSNIYIIGGLLLLTLVYLFFSLINFYRQSFLKSFTKFFLLVGLYTIAIIPALALLMFLAFLSV